jgi:aldose 1-epimerase
MTSTQSESCLKHLRTLVFILALFAITASPCAAGISRSPNGRIEKKPFGKLADGTPIDVYTLTNRNGLQAQITNYGGIVVSFKVPDRRGQMADVVLGYDDVGSYVDDTAYLGCILGRYANRIAKGRFTLGGVEYTLAQNNNGNHLHGGLRGFNKVVWQARQLNNNALQLTYTSRDGEEGYPGNMTATVTYILTPADELRIEYAATTDKETIVNLSQHTYFNLAGAGVGDILGHKIRINADRFTPIDETSIPTGELRAVRGTPLDFTRETAIGARINAQDEQLRRGSGYDHNYVVNKTRARMSLAAEVFEPVSGRAMQVWTTQPGVQLYTGNFLDNVHGKAGKVYQRREGFCLETQHFPDSPNKPAFPSTVLSPNGRYTQTTVYKMMAKTPGKKP